MHDCGIVKAGGSKFKGTEQLTGFPIRLSGTVVPRLFLSMDVDGLFKNLKLTRLRLVKGDIGSRSSFIIRL